MGQRGRSSWPSSSAAPSAFTRPSRKRRCFGCPCPHDLPPSYGAGHGAGADLSGRQDQRRLPVSQIMGRGDGPVIWCPECRYIFDGDDINCPMCTHPLEELPEGAVEGRRRAGGSGVAAAPGRENRRRRSRPLCWQIWTALPRWPSPFWGRTGSRPCSAIRRWGDVGASLFRLFHHRGGAFWHPPAGWRRQRRFWTKRTGRPT